MKVAGFDWDEGNWPKCGKHGVSREEIEEVLDAVVSDVDSDADEIIEVIDAATGAGITKVGIVTDAMRKAGGADSL